MKKFLLQFVEALLKILARWTIKKYDPGIIGVTGSVGKTSTKEAIYTVLRNIRRVRLSRGNFNSQIGLPLTILGDWPDAELELFSREYPQGRHRPKKLIFLIKVVCVSLFGCIFGKRSKYPELLILEYGADRPGDIKYLLEIARPKIAVVSALEIFLRTSNSTADREEWPKKKAGWWKRFPQTVLPY